MEDIQDVVIIGGGPAGATNASYLSMLGHRVTLFEKEKFPRDHVGESLLPWCYGIFKEIGILDQMKASFVRKPGVRFVDSNGVQTTTWCFSRVIHDESFLSFQVARNKFDTMQLENSRRHGATVYEETRVEKVDQDNSAGIIAVQAVGPDGQNQIVKARFIIDCSGRSTFLANQKGKRQKFPELDRTALWTHWSGAPLAGGLEEGLSLIIYLGGEKKGWLWVFPLGPDHLTVGVVVSNSYIREQKSKFRKQGIDNWQMALYQQELNYSPYVTKLLAPGHIIQPLVIEGDYSYFTTEKYGSNFALVGDAAAFIDPIFSSGIFIAMNSSRLVSKAIHKILTGEESWESALNYAYTKIEGAYKMVGKLIEFFYNSGSINFAQMETASELIHKQHENAMATGHFLLAGDFFDRYDTYGKIIDLLNTPNLFKAYQNLVIRRADFRDTTCHMSIEDTFHQLLSETTPD